MHILKTLSVGLFILILFLLIRWTLQKTDEIYSFHSLQDLKTSILHYSNSEDSLDLLWDYLELSENIPFAIDDSVAFLFKGDAKSIQFNGDFNGWGRDTSLNTKALLQNSTDIWWLPVQLPSNARIDYKVVINDKDWILDPYNTKIRYSGFGPNSELQMPDFVFPESIIARKNIEHGSDSTYLINSNHLEYVVTYSVYTPPKYDSNTDYPVLFVLDGHEYRNDKLGNLITVTENLLERGEIEPFIIVTIDPRVPGNKTSNRRMSEYANNPFFADFIASELLTKIEEDYSLTDDRNQRAVLGTSMGGLAATYIYTRHPSIFGKIGIQSPAYRYRSQIFDLVKRNLLPPPHTVFISTGTLHDTEAETDSMTTIFDRKKWNYKLVKIPQGHSWGNWLYVLDQTLITLFGKNE